MRRRRGEEGYALVAAVASIAVFATIALGAIRAGEGRVAAAAAEIDRAKASAAADAGTTLALSGLLNRDLAHRWPIDSRPHRIAFGGASLVIHIEDEHGKVPINALEDEQAKALLAGLGLTGNRLLIATDSLQDWIDDDQDPRPHGAEDDYYARLGIRPRNGAIQSIGEVARIRGFDAALAARLATVATVNFGTGSFETRYAQPLAIRVMAVNSDGSSDSDAVDEINQARENAGQRTAIALTDDGPLTGRPLTIVVDADLPGRAHVERRTVIELTGSATQPYIVHEADG